MSIRVIGMTLSVLMLAVVLVSVTIMMRGREKTAGEQVRPEDLIQAGPEPIDLEAAARGPTDLEQLPVDTGAIVWTKQNERGEVTQEFGWASLDPLPAGRFLLHRPEARFYLSRGETVYLEAAEAEVFKPTSSEMPETGRFQDGVIVRMYDGHIHGDLSKHRPKMEMRTPWVEFDTAIGQLSTDERFFATSPSLEFEGVGLSVLYNEVAERIERLDVRRGDRLLYNPDAARSSERETGPSLDSVNVGHQGTPRPADDARDGMCVDVSFQPGETSGAPAAVREDYYRIVFDEQVSVRQRNRVITARHLESEVRLVDGTLALPNGPAFAARPSSSDRAEWQPACAPCGVGIGASSAGPSVAAWIASLAIAQLESAFDGTDDGEDGIRSLLEPSDDLVVLTWAGPLSVRPIEEPPPSLVEDGAHVLFIGEPVHLEDESAGHHAQCQALDYYATRQKVELSGVVGQDIVMTMASGEQVRGRRFVLSLATGHGRFDGPGRAMRGVDEVIDGSDALSIDWQERATVRFDVDAGSLGELREVVCEGAVCVEHETFHVDGDWLRVALDDDDQQGHSRVSALSVRGDVTGIAHGSGEVECQRIDAIVELGTGGELRPTIVTARGDVLALSNDGGRIEADLAELAFDEGPSEDGEQKLRIARFEARSDGVTPVRLDSGDGLTAEAALVAAGPDTVTITLTGEPAIVRTDEAMMSGGVIDVDRERGLVTVPGAGRFAYQRAGDGEGERLDVTWQGRMQYDGQTGVVRCAGDVAGVHAPNVLEINSVACQSLTVRFDTSSDGVNDDGPFTVSRLVRLDAEESASIRHVRYLDPEHRSLDRFVDIAGDRITYDDVQGRLIVPTPGRMALADVRAYLEHEADGADTSDAEPPTDFGTGNTLFTWQGEMELSAPDGMVRMRRDVEMRHRDREDADLLIVECQHLEAFTTPVDLAGNPVTPSPQRDVQLVRALARQAVYVEYGDRQLLADEISYDAITQMLAARAVPGNTVTAYRIGDLAPQKVDWLEWNLSTGEVRLHGLRPVHILRTR